jgi:hypothetical protein
MSGRLSRGAGMFLVLGLAGMATLVLALVVDASRYATHPGPMFAGLIGLGGMGWLLLRGPVGKAIANILEGGSAEADMLVNSRVAELEDRLHELSLETQRLMEIEDRLEFAERMIAEQASRKMEVGDGR